MHQLTILKFSSLKMHYSKWICGKIWKWGAERQQRAGQSGRTGAHRYTGHIRVYWINALNNFTVCFNELAFVPFKEVQKSWRSESCWRCDVPTEYVSEVLREEMDCMILLNFRQLFNNFWIGYNLLDKIPWLAKIKVFHFSRTCLDWRRWLWGSRPAQIYGYVLVLRWF